MNHVRKRAEVAMRASISRPPDQSDRPSWITKKHRTGKIMLSHFQRSKHSQKRIGVCSSGSDQRKTYANFFVLKWPRLFGNRWIVWDMIHEIIHRISSPLYLQWLSGQNFRKQPHTDMHGIHRETQTQKRLILIKDFCKRSSKKVVSHIDCLLLPYESGWWDQCDAKAHTVPVPLLSFFTSL